MLYMGIMIQVILVIVVLASVVMILLGLDQLFSGKFNSDQDKVRELRDEVEHRRDVISDNSVFRGLVSKSQNNKAPSSMATVRHGGNIKAKK